MLTNTSRSPHTRAAAAVATAGQGPQNVPRAGEVRDNDLDAGCPQGVGPFVSAADQRADRQVAPPQCGHDGTADSADAARGAGNKDRMDRTHGTTPLPVTVV